MEVFFITGNHNSEEIVEDFFSYYLDNFSDFDINFSKKIIPNKINIILEEFTNTNFCKEIQKIKINEPSTKIFVFFSEHLTKINQFNYTFNFFEKKNLINLTSFKIFRYLTSIEIIYKFKSLNQAINHKKKIILLKLITNLLKKIDKNLIFYEYMMKRFLYFDFMSDYFDIILSLDSQDTIDLKEYYEDKVEILEIYPVAQMVKSGNKLGIGISGAINKFRLNYLNKIKKKISIENNIKNFTSLKVNNFYFKNNFYTYSIHIPKSQDWYFHSIIKYLFSISNNEIPFLSHKVKYETKGKYLCLNLNDIEDLNNPEKYDYYLSEINSKIKTYLKFYEQKKILLNKNLINKLNYGQTAQ